MASWGQTEESAPCLYQVLGVDRNADQPTIRSAYKKLVLRWHPDRNLDNARDAEIRFKEIQTAFDILSNENERAWYDANQERILKGTSSSSGEMIDPCGLDLYQYFSLSCFDGFSDNATGFYFIFASAFAGVGQAEEVSVPKFGDSNSSWSRVRKFYAFWDTFSTRRKFRWAAKFNLNDAANRRERGLMKKANAKAMEQCRREWEGNVRRLVRFVKNLDPRVRNHALQEMEEERMNAEEERLKNQEISDVMAARRARDLQEEVDKLDQTMEEEPASTQLACLICRRKFRSRKTLMNHQSSAKHMQRVKRLQAHLQREEKLVFGMGANAEEDDTEEDVYETVPPPPAMNDDVPDDDASSVAAASVISGFSDFVLIEELNDVGDDDDEEDDYSYSDDEDGVQIEFWDETFAVDSDQELDLVGVDFLDGVVRSRATDDVVAPPSSSVPDVSMDLLLAQQLASGVNMAGDGDLDRTVLAQVMDPTNLDRLLALQLEQEDLMARRALAADGDRDANAIHSDEDGYDSELDTLVDALNAKMISLDDPNVNVKDLEKRLQRAIARSGSSKCRKSKKKKNKKRVRRNRDVRVSNSSDEAEEGVSQFMDSFRKGKEVVKTKKELRGDKRKRRRRRRLANDPQSTSRCAVCHRGFASKTKLNRHIEANPSHVSA